MVDYAPGMRTIIRDEEWMVKKVEKNNMGNNALYCVGVSPLVKDKEAVFLTDLEEIAVVDPKDVKLVIDGSSFFRRTQLYLVSAICSTDKSSKGCLYQWIWQDVGVSARKVTIVKEYQNYEFDSMPRMWN